MSHSVHEPDSVFHGAGAKPGLEIWCIEELRLVPVPKSLHGKFYSGSAYIVLNTVLFQNSPPHHDIHYWLGNDANKVDSALVSDKSLELDAALGSCAVQYREVQGLETERFLSYFKPCIIPIEGVYRSQPGHLNVEAYQISLLTCKGDHAVHVKEVPFSRSSLNHDDVFILDTASKIFLFSGCNSTIQERAKSLEVVEFIKEDKHNGKCEIATIEDGTFAGDADVGEFWSLFGGYAPIPRDSTSAQMQPDATSTKLFWVTTQGKLCYCESNSRNKEMLEKDKCYMLDCGTEIFVWMGRNTLLTERKTSISAVEDFLRTHGRSTHTHLTFLAEGLETAKFKSYFDKWPQPVEANLYEEGRGKVAAIFKHQGYEVKELPEDDCEKHINCRGMLKVWRVNGDELSLLPVAEQTKLFSGDCYIIQYTYPDSGRDENIFYAWFGRASVMEDRVDTITRINSLVDSTKGNPVVAQVIEDKEPIQFFLILQRLVVFKGGMSTRYNQLMGETFDEKKTALFRVQGTGPTNMQAIQVDQVSSSLNSSYCYILQTETCVFTWIGSLSLTKDHDLLDRMLEVIDPTWQPLSVREGSEPDIFWEVLGGKAEYPREKDIRGYLEDPHLFVLACTEGNLKVKEIYNFTQDDLTTEDVMVLDCHREIYVWVGLHSKITSKQEAITLGQKFLEADILVEGLSSETPIYVVTEGHEPSFFTRFFEWDSSKANMHGNSFERKLAILKGKAQSMEVHMRTSLKLHTPNGSRSKSLSSGDWGRGASSTPSVTRSRFKSPDTTLHSSPTSVTRNLFSGSSTDHGSAGSLVMDPTLPSENNVGSSEIDGSEASTNLPTFPYERLKVLSSDPVSDIDVTKREAYLSEEEFEQHFGMKKQSFYKIPKWRQNKLKTSLNLF